MFVNGREINLTEAMFYQKIFGSVQPGRYWLDSGGNVGYEGNPTPVANLVVAIRQAISSGGSHGSRVDGLNVVSSGNCTMAGSYGVDYQTKGCD